MSSGIVKYFKDALARLKRVRETVTDVREVKYNLNPDGSFMSEDEIVEDILAHRIDDAETYELLLYDFDPPVSEDDKLAIMASGFNPNAFARFQFGMWIRNSYGLWNTTNPHVTFDPHRRHPDNIAGRVIEKVVARVKAA